MRRPPRTIMQNVPPFITNRSSPGGGLRGGVFHKCSDIYTPHPKTAPYQGMLNIYFLSRETPRPWRVHVCLSDPLLGGGGWVLSPERVRCNTGTVTPHRRRLCVLNAEHPQCSLPPKKDGWVPVCVGIMPMLRWTAWHYNFDNDIISFIQGQLKVVEFLSFYIWTMTNPSYKHGSMFWIFGGFGIVTIIFFHAFCMSYHIWLCSCRPCDITLLFFFFINNYPIRKKHLSSDQI